MVVRDAAAAQSPLSHNRVEAGIGVHRVAATASWRLHEGVDGSIASVLLLDLSVPLASNEEEDGAQCRSDSNNTNHDTCHNCPGIGGAAFLGRIRVSTRSSCDVNDTRCGRRQHPDQTEWEIDDLLWPPDTTVDEATTVFAAVLDVADVVLLSAA